MAIPGLCGATNIRKYYCKNYFLTFKCYCFPTRAAVLLLPRSFRSMASMTDGKKRPCRGGGGGGGGGGVVVVFIETPEPDRPPSVQLLGQTINVSIIECLSKKARVWGALKILWLVIMPPLTPPPPLPLASRSPPPRHPRRRLSSSSAAL